MVKTFRVEWDKLTINERDMQWAVNNYFGNYFGKVTVTELDEGGEWCGWCKRGIKPQPKEYCECESSASSPKNPKLCFYCNKPRQLPKTKAQIPHKITPNDILTIPECVPMVINNIIDYLHEREKEDAK